MLKKLRNENKGFTIIEVMIVLAIAGLIILIVLLAVPALQRNGRNTGIKNDASSVAAAVSEFESNNDGALPQIDASHPSSTGTKVDITGTAGSTTPSTAKIQSTTTVSGKTGTGPAANVKVNRGEIWVYKGARCDGTASTRSVTIWYAVESNNAAAAADNRCIDA